MSSIQFIIEHIEKVYGFEKVPCSIPRDNFQYFKRYIYLFILNKVSKKLFYFLRDKVSPIKYLDERPNGVLWFRKRDSTIEVEIRPIPVEACIYASGYGFNHNMLKTFKPTDKNYKVSLYLEEHPFRTNFATPWSLPRPLPPFGNGLNFPINHISGIETIDAYFSIVPEFKEILRDYKLKAILD